ncbi:MAG: tetraacyldisaccharide 4'-kinase [Gilvibacter sp.]
MNPSRKILFPFAVAYDGITRLRNKLYDKGWLSSKSYDLPVICVGNLSVGGTGKSPMIEYLIALLQDDFRVAVLSRGYGRSTKGYIEVVTTHRATEVGDEPLQFKRKFPKVTIAVCADRQEGIEALQKQNVEVVLLDDAFQHRKVKPGFSILLTTYQNPFVDDLILPAGDLRETSANAKRADAIVITKIPEKVAYAHLQQLQVRLRQDMDQQVFMSRISYSDEITSATDNLPLSFLSGKRFTLVTGIANPNPLVAFLESKGFDFEHLKYPDHHDFSQAEIARISQSELILTTEKDFVRLSPNIAKKAMYALPIKTSFMERQSVFEEMVLDYIHTHWNKIV